jgi:hypothetical protein
VKGTGAGGRYLVLGPDGEVHGLASFSDVPELACYSAAEAVRVSEAVEESETIEGKLAPQWPTDVVCGFLDATEAACWQYSPGDRAFVEVGGWIT